MSYVFLSPSCFTGGPLAIHQAAAEMRRIGCDARIMYVTNRELGAGTQAFVRQGDRIRMRRNLRPTKPDPRLLEFGIPRVVTAPRDCSFILPEVWPDLASSLLHHGCEDVALWWLSVDNFPLNLVKQLANQRLFRNCLNLCQSTYAADFVKKNGGRRIMRLSDFVDFGVVQDTPPLPSRLYDIAYLPSKARGAENVLQDLSVHYRIIALEGMDRSGIIAALSNSKIFLDCGNQPGKDRVPREAALCGAIPLVRHEGAARFAMDVPLPQDLLVSTDAFFNSARLRQTIEAVLADPTRFDGPLDAYRRTIDGERDQFKNDVAQLVQYAQGCEPDWQIIDPFARYANTPEHDPWLKVRARG